MKYRYLIVDDEPYARKLIKSHTSKIEGLEWVGECNSAIEASNFLRHNKVDLLFLDIQMPEMTGLQFIGTLRNPPAVIITTAHRDFAPEAFTLDAIDYLLKPISFERLLKAVNKFFGTKQTLVSKPETRDDFIFLKADRRLNKVFVNEILFIESLDDYVRAHLPGKVLIVKENISTLEDKLKDHSFIRIHRSFLVSARHVKSVSSDGVEIEKKLLPFGRSFKNAAISLLGLEKK